MTLQSDLEAAVADAQADSQKLKDIVNGPAAGAGSLVEVASGWVKTVARAIAEIGDTSLQALKDLSNVLAADFFDAATAADVAGNMRKADNLAGLVDASTARQNLGVEIGVDVQAHDANTLKSDATANLTKGYTTPPGDLGNSASATFNLAIADGNEQKIAITGDPTLAAPAAGEGNIMITCANDGAGPHSVSFSGFSADPLPGSKAWDVTNGAVNYVAVKRQGAVSRYGIYNNA